PLGQSDLELADPVRAIGPFREPPPFDHRDAKSGAHAGTRGDRWRLPRRAAAVRRQRARACPGPGGVARARSIPVLARWTIRALHGARPLPLGCDRARTDWLVLRRLRAGH